MKTARDVIDLVQMTDLNDYGAIDRPMPVSHVGSQV